MNLKGLLFLIFWVSCSFIQAQNQINADILILAQYTLEKNPNLKRSLLQIKNNSAEIQIQQSIFDLQLASEASASLNKSYLFEADPTNIISSNNFLETQVLEFSIGLQKKISTGLDIGLFGRYNQSADNLLVNSFNENIEAFTPSRNIETTLTLTQPLLRGRGKNITNALIDASELSVASAQNAFSLLQTFEVAQTANAYWIYLQAFKNLQVYKENEARVTNVLEITNQLVKADKKPKSDLIQIKADLANQKRQTEAAKQSYFNAKMNLALTIGLSENEGQHLSEPQQNFPEISDQRKELKIDKEKAIITAKNLRKDLKSNKNIEASIEKQLILAKNNRQAQLNLGIFGSYGGLNMGQRFPRLFPAFNGQQGLNYSAGVSLNFSFPLQNNLSKGSFAQNKIALSDQQIITTNLERSITLNVSIAINNLEQSVLIYEKAEEAFEYYKDAFENEKKKFQNGLTTLLNLILFQERLTFSELDFIQAQQQFAVALINLKYETGTLITKTSDNNIINVGTFYELPDFQNL